MGIVSEWGQVVAGDILNGRGEQRQDEKKTGVQVENGF
jgi:hypothetical protein